MLPLIQNYLPSFSSYRRRKVKYAHTGAKMLVPGPVGDRNIDHRSFFPSESCSRHRYWVGTTMRFLRNSFFSSAEISYYLIPYLTNSGRNLFVLETFFSMDTFINSNVIDFRQRTNPALCGTCTSLKLRQNHAADGWRRTT